MIFVNNKANEIAYAVEFFYNDDLYYTIKNW